MSHPKPDRWKRYNDLVSLQQTLWLLKANPPERANDANWTKLTDGFISLVDECARLRFWLEFVLTADTAELDQWRNGEFAAALVNGFDLSTHEAATHADPAYTPDGNPH